MYVQEALFSPLWQLQPDTVFAKIWFLGHTNLYLEQKFTVEVTNLIQEQNPKHPKGSLENQLVQESTKEFI